MLGTLVVGLRIALRGGVGRIRSSRMLHELALLDLHYTHLLFIHSIQINWNGVSPSSHGPYFLSTCQS